VGQDGKPAAKGLGHDTPRCKQARAAANAVGRRPPKWAHGHHREEAEQGLMGRAAAPSGLPAARILAAERGVMATPLRPGV